MAARYLGRVRICKGSRTVRKERVSKGKRWSLTSMKTLLIFFSWTIFLRVGRVK